MAKFGSCVTYLLTSNLLIDNNSLIIDKPDKPFMRFLHNTSQKFCQTCIYSIVYDTTKETLLLPAYFAMQLQISPYDAVRAIFHFKK